MEILIHQFIKKVIWGIIVAAIAYILLSTRSLKPLQVISIAASLPFLFIMLAMMPAMLKEMRRDPNVKKELEDKKYYERIG